MYSGSLEGYRFNTEGRGVIRKPEEDFLKEATEVLEPSRWITDPKINFSLIDPDLPEIVQQLTVLQDGIASGSRFDAADLEEIGSRLTSALGFGRLINQEDNFTASMKGDLGTHHFGYRDDGETVAFTRAWSHSSMGGVILPIAQLIMHKGNSGNITFVEASSLKNTFDKEGSLAVIGRVPFNLKSRIMQRAYLDLLSATLIRPPLASRKS